MKIKKMFLNQDDKNYLMDKSISNAFVFKVPFKNAPFYKFDLLRSIVTKKNILHIGFADHIDLIDEKISKGVWLHKLLMEKTNTCLGLDINEEAVQHVKSKHNIPNVFCANLLTDDLVFIKNQQWDHMILGEILEHIDSPQIFLRGIKEKYQNYVKSIIITVPNAFYIRNILFSLRGKEAVNSDHRYWFTPYTLCKHLMLAGLEPQSIYMCQGHHMSPKYLMVKGLLHLFPLMRSTIIVEASLK